MYKITLLNQTFKSSFDITKDTVYQLPHSFVVSDTIKKHEWAHSKQNIIERFNLSPVIEKIDGRTKQAKEIKKYFSWNILKELKR